MVLERARRRSSVGTRLDRQGCGYRFRLLGRRTGEGCVGTDDFADLRPGVAVRVFDQSGHELSQGRLGTGLPGKVVGNSCTWGLTVSDIPSGASQYQLQIGDRERLGKTGEELRRGVDLSFVAQ